jgi:hypothetical protein
MIAGAAMERKPAIAPMPMVNGISCFNFIPSFYATRSSESRATGDKPAGMPARRQNGGPTLPRSEFL